MEAVGSPIHLIGLVTTIPAVWAVFTLRLIPHILWTTKTTPDIPTRNSRIISKPRVQRQPPIATDRNIRQLQINAPNDKNVVRDTLAITVRNSSPYWFSSTGHHCSLSSCRSWLHQERKSLILVI
jgi:hypothetical protein